MAFPLPISTGKPYSRLDNFPLDLSCSFETLAEAENYGLNSPIKYTQQLIGCIETDTVYMIKNDGSLKDIFSGGITGPLTTDDVTLSEAITLIGTSLGALDEGAEMPVDTTLTDLLKMLAVKRIAAIYTASTISLAASGTKTVEVGTSVSTSITTTFVANDAGAVTEYRVTKGGVTVHTAATVDAYSADLFVIGAEDITFRSFVDYAEGAIKNDNLGTPSPVGQIAAGTASSSNVIFSGKRGSFWGAEASPTALTDSLSIRALSGKALGQSNGATFNLTVPIGSRKVTVAYPASLRALTSCKYVEQGQAEYVTNFVESNVMVEGVDGAAAENYRVYTWSYAIENPSAMTLNFTI